MRGRQHSRHLAQAGGIIPLIAAAAMLATGLAVTFGSTLIQSYIPLFRMQRAQTAAHQIEQASMVLAKNMTTQAGISALQPPSPVTGSPAPTNGGQLPTTLGLARTDPYGTAYGMCAWSHGGGTPGTNVLTGVAVAYTSSPVYALISAGPDKTFNTSCTDAWNQSVQGDDKLEVVSYATMATQASVLVQDSATGNSSFAANTSASLAIGKAVPDSGYRLDVNGAGQFASVTITGALSAVSSTLSGALVAASSTLSGALSAATATITGAVTAGSLSTSSATITGGTINNTAIGGSTPASVTGTTVTGTTSVTAPRLVSTTATGTSPLTVTSTTLVSNLTAHYLGVSGQDAAYFTNSSNHISGTLDPNRLPTMSGDVSQTRTSSTARSATVTALRGVSISATAPTTNQVLTYNGSAWAPAAVPTPTGIPNSSLTNSSVTLGTTSVALGATAATLNGLGLSGATFSGATTLPGSGSIDSSGNLVIGTGSIGTSGTSSISLKTGTTEQFRVSHTASAVNYLQATGAATGAAPTLSAQGSDTNVAVKISAKGTGGVNLVSGYVENANGSLASCTNSGSATTISATLATQVYCYTLNSNATITMPVISSIFSAAGTTYGVWNLTLRVVQDATGSRTLTIAAGSGDTVKWDASATQPAIATSANKETLFQCIALQGVTSWRCGKVFTEN